MHKNDNEIDNTVPAVAILVLASVGVLAVLKQAGFRFNFGISGKVGGK